jgi:Esterase PHB depolymerase
VLDSHKLIWIGANHSGNDRALWCRAGLAIDAAYNVQQQYKIDPARVYVAGMSGGSKIASLVGVAYSDVFAGGIYCCGTSFYRDIEAPSPAGERLADNQRRVYPRAFYPPPLKLLTMAKQISRHVLLTGEHDMNRDSTQAIYEKGFKLDGFKYVTYLEVPAMGHQLPPAEWFQKAVEAVDQRATAVKGPGR